MLAGISYEVLIAFSTPMCDFVEEQYNLVKNNVKVLLIKNKFNIVRFSV